MCGSSSRIRGDEGERTTATVVEHTRVASIGVADEQVNACEY